MERSIVKEFSLEVYRKIYSFAIWPPMTLFFDLYSLQIVLAKHLVEQQLVSRLEFDIVSQ